jgi:hypothetical protein
LKRATPFAIVTLAIGCGFCEAACGVGAGGELAPGAGDGGGGKDATGGRAADANADVDTNSKDGATDAQDATVDAPANADASADDGRGDVTGADGGVDSGSDGGDTPDARSDGGVPVDAGLPEGNVPDAALDAPGPPEGGTDATAVEAGGPDDSGSPDADATDDGSDGPTTCDFTGTWGSRLTIDVNWAPQGLVGVILAPGSGQIRQWIKTTRMQNGSATTETTVVCGVALPDFQGTQVAGAETYGVRFPNTLFDSGFLSTFTIDGTLSGATPGSTYSTAPAAALLGLTLTNPSTDPWPATVTTAVDTDQDGSPGVTIHVARGNGYSDVPVDFFKTQRANQLFVVIRQITQINATFSDCDHLSGTVSIPRIPSSASGKYAIDSHIVGCSLSGSGAACDATQTNFVDATQPVFTPTGPSDFTSIRLPNGATCATVRQQLP